MSKKLHTVFSKADYKFQKVIEQLEKERRQRCSRLQKEKRLFEMSLKPPNMKGESSYRNQYGERFHANGDLISEKRTRSRSASPGNWQTKRENEWGKNFLTRFFFKFTCWISFQMTLERLNESRGVGGGEGAKDLFLTARAH